MKAGDKIRIDWMHFGCRWAEVEDYTIVEYRHTLGIFKSEEARKAGHLTPLCELYYDGPDTERDYISNYGEYKTNLVQGWADIV